VIADDPEYKAALASAALLMGARGGTAAGERLKVLVGLIEAYERQHFPLDLAAPTGSKPAGARRAAKRPTRA
jgi:HTH-type transcriptional regulator/antitoxin HigA